MNAWVVVLAALNIVQSLVGLVTLRRLRAERQAFDAYIAMTERS